MIATQHIVAAENRVYKAAPTLSAFHCDNSFVRGVMGPIGSGKSVAMCMELVMRAMAQKPYNGVRSSRWAVIRQTYRELETTTMRTWSEWIPESYAPIRWTQPPTCRLKTDLADGTRVEAEILFMAVDRTTVSKLRSLELTGCWVNEAREIPKVVIDTLTGRVGRYPAKRDGGPSWSGIFMDTNPPPQDDKNWWYYAAEISRPDGWKFFRQPPALLFDDDGRFSANPDAENVENHTLGYGYWTRQLANKDPDWVKVYICGEYGSVFDGKPVYAGIYSHERHTTDRPLGIYRGLPLYLGWDFGLTPACIAAQVSPHGQIRALREWICSDGALREFVTGVVRPALRNEFAEMQIISTCDPAGAQRSQVDEATCISELSKLGIPTRAAVTNQFVPRRQAVITPLMRMIGDEPGLVIDPSCVMLRRGFAGGYQFRRMKAGAGELYHDEPMKNEFSHIHDAFQYLCLLVEGDKGETRRAWPERPSWG